MDHKNHGPFQVEKIVSPLAIRLTLPRKWKIHNVIHVSLLESSTSFTKPERVSVTTDRVLAVAERVVAVVERASASAKRVAATLAKQIVEEETQVEQIGEEETPEAKIKTMEARMGILKEA